MNLTTSEFFANMKNLPVVGTQEFFDLRDWEREKCLGGVNVNGVHIPGFLYWHLNHWYIGLDAVDKHGNDIKIPGHPELRDNEWIIADGLEQARKERKGLMIAGSRRIGKSEVESSFCYYNVAMFEGTQNVIVGGDEGDLGIIKAKLDFGIPKVWEGIQVPKLDNDWRKPMIKMGFKSKDGTDSIWGYIVLRNVAKGKNTEGPAGVTSKSFIGDEIAKYPFAQAFEAAKPSFMTEKGWGCVPFLCCTGGNADMFADAERYFYNPEANKFISYTHQETGERTGLFLSGLYRPDCKEKTNLADYLIETGRLVADGNYPELQKIEMKVSNKEVAYALIKEERLIKSADPDQTEYLKQVMYFPLEPKECFLSTTENFYNMEIARQQKEKLEASEYKPMYIDLVETAEGIIHKPSSALPISTYPCKKTENLNAPICVIEHPIPNPPYGLYVIGIDPYRFEKAKYTDSLGAVYVFKRAYDALSDTFQDMPVAWYVARPDSKETWNNNARLLIKYYNGTALCENDEMSFIDYMISKGEGHLLADTPEWIKEYNPTSAANIRPKGVSSSPKNIELFRTNLKQYMEEHFITIPIPGKDEGKKLNGVCKINDTVFLEEIIKWNKDGNFDRERALSIAITYARKLDTMRVNVRINDEDPRFQVGTYKKGRSNSMFPNTEGSTYRTRHNNIKRLFK